MNGFIALGIVIILANILNVLLAIAISIDAITLDQASGTFFLMLVSFGISIIGIIRGPDRS